MAKKYQIWNGTDEIYTPTGAHFTAKEWADRYGWAKIPGAKMVISAGVVNGGCAMEFESMKATYLAAGAAITDGMTDEEILAAIEAFEDQPREAPPTAEERAANALEAMAAGQTTENAQALNILLGEG